MVRMGRGLRPARRECAPDAASSPAEIHQKGSGFGEREGSASGLRLNGHGTSLGQECFSLTVTHARGALHSRQQTCDDRFTHHPKHAFRSRRGAARRASGSATRSSRSASSPRSGERRGDPVERIATPDRLRAWFTANGLGGADMPVSDALLRDARDLREAIHRAGTAIASGGVPDPADEELLNHWSARHRARLMLTGGQAQWHLPDTDSARGARQRLPGRPRDPRRPLRRCDQAVRAAHFRRTLRGRRPRPTTAVVLHVDLRIHGEKGQPQGSAGDGAEAGHEAAR